MAPSSPHATARSPPPARAAEELEVHGHSLLDLVNVSVGTPRKRARGTRTRRRWRPEPAPARSALAPPGCPRAGAGADRVDALVAGRPLLVVVHGESGRKQDDLDPSASRSITRRKNARFGPWRQALVEVRLHRDEVARGCPAAAGSTSSCRYSSRSTPRQTGRAGTTAPEAREHQARVHGGRPAPSRASAGISSRSNRSLRSCFRSRARARRASAPLAYRSAGSARRRRPPRLAKSSYQAPPRRG